MICPYCNTETTPINLKGKLYCENCGLALGEAPETVAPAIPETTNMPEPTQSISPAPFQPAPPSNDIRQIHELEITDQSEQGDKIGPNEIPISDEKTISELSSGTIQAPPTPEPDPSINEPLKKIMKEELVIKKPLEEELLKQLNIDDSHAPKEDEILPSNDSVDSNPPNQPEIKTEVAEKTEDAIKPVEPDYVSPQKYEPNLDQPTSDKPTPISNPTLDKKPVIPAQKPESIAEPDPELNTSKISQPQPHIENNSESDINENSSAVAIDKSLEAEDSAKSDITETKPQPIQAKPTTQENTKSASPGVDLVAPDNTSFSEKVKGLDTLGASGILLDILDDKAIEGEATQKISSYKAAETLLEKDPDIFSTKPELEATPPPPESPIQPLPSSLDKPPTTLSDSRPMSNKDSLSFKSDPLANSPANPIKHLEFLDIKPPKDLPTTLETEEENLEIDRKITPPPSIEPRQANPSQEEALDPRHTAVKNYFNNIFETKR